MYMQVQGSHVHLSDRHMCVNLGFKGQLGAPTSNVYHSIPFLTELFLNIHNWLAPNLNVLPHFATNTSSNNCLDDLNFLPLLF